MSLSFRTRTGSAALVLAMHLGLGLLLIASSGARSGGGPASLSDDGKMVMVSLIPRGRERSIPQDGIQPGTSLAQRPPPLRQHHPHSHKSDTVSTGVAMADAEGAVQSGSSVATSLQSPQINPESLQLFRDVLLAHIEQFRRYPPEAQRAVIQGTVYLHFVMDRSGEITAIWVGRSSGSLILDEEAMAAIRRAAPLPFIPPGWPPHLDVTLPIVFALG
jgi:protein TonB